MIPILEIALSLPVSNSAPPSLTGTTQGGLVSWNLPKAPENYRIRSFDSPSVEHRLASINQLTDGWHGDGSISVGSTVIERVRGAMRLIAQAERLSVPEITPTANGTISLEWESDHISIYVEVGRTRVNGFIQGKTSGLMLISETNSLDLAFFQGLGEILRPSVGTPFTSVIRLPGSSYSLIA